MKNQKTVTLRISDDLLDKLCYVALSEGRSLNNQLLLMSRNAVAYFEKTKGKIDPKKISAMRAEIDGEIEA